MHIVWKQRMVRCEMRVAKGMRFLRTITCCALAVFTLWAGIGGADGGEEAAKEAARRANVPEDVWILISLQQKSLTLYKGVVPQRRYGIASGTSSLPSPIGTYTVTHRFSGDLGGFGTRFLGLNVPWGQFGIHGTNKPGSIGSNASHGCIRMLTGDCEALYRVVPNGTKVVLEGGPYGLLDTNLRSLRPGDRNSHVVAVQNKLRALGYYNGSSDGIYGRGTQDAVRRARRALELPAGDVDQAFYQAIGLILFE
jgi:hypothetical protein